MKLFLTYTSPYARKARIVMHEQGLRERVQEVLVDHAAKPAELLAVNPTGKIPALLTEEFALFDSRVICEYLDSLAPDSLFPEAPQIWRDKTRVALGDALMDAAVALMLEKRRHEEQRAAWFSERERSRIERIVRACEQGGESRERPSMGDISIVCALAYLDLRLPELEWPRLAPALEVWTEQLEARPAFAATRLG